MMRNIDDGNVQKVGGMIDNGKGYKSELMGNPFNEHSERSSELTHHKLTTTQCSE
jgi:hypothetical protein